jgi:hypothetical protein
MNPATTRRIREIFDDYLQSNLSRHGCEEPGGTLHDQARNQSTSSHEPQRCLGPPYVHTSLTHLSISPTYLRWPRCIARRNLGVRVSSSRESDEAADKRTGTVEMNHVKKCYRVRVGCSVVVTRNTRVCRGRAAVPSGWCADTPAIHRQ